MEPAAAAELKTVLVGVPLPAGKGELLEYAVRQRAEPQLLDALRSLPGREYASLDGIVEDLLHVQPSREAPAPSRPREESGGPPGGEAYTERQPEPGAVRASRTT